MAFKTNIAWCDSTFNGWIGCTKVAPPCDFCYAEDLMDHRYKRVQWGPHGERVRTSDANWKKPIQWDKKAKASGVRHKVFSASLSDWLDNQAPDQWRTDLAELIEKTPNLDWLLLTKRIGNFGNYAPWQSNQVPKNVWLGISCGSQEEYDREWPKLRAIAEGNVRFISYEPALGPLRLRNESSQPSWLICGGESGRFARRMDIQWARDVKGDCRQFNVAFFMKQMGENNGLAGITGAGTDINEWPADIRIQEFPR